MTKELKVIELSDQWSKACVEFSDNHIGEGYFTLQDIRTIVKKSVVGSINCSFLLVHNYEVLGMRLTLVPGAWNTGKGRGKLMELWPHSVDKMAYFQSLFIDKRFQRLGWGRQLSNLSLERLKQVGAKGVVCHAWKESPDRSSVGYLKKMGFRSVGEHKHYWYHVEYLCSRCQKVPCLCTAIEMILDFVEEE